MLAVVYRGAKFPNVAFIICSFKTTKGYTVKDTI